MWVASVLGFYSISYREGAYNVRGRTRGDLENLIEASGVQATVLELPEADYRYRLVLDKAAFGLVMAALARSVTYSNFKDQIKHTPGQADKEPYYMRVWATMARYGDEAHGLQLPLAEGDEGWDEDEEPPLPPLDEEG